MQINCKRIQNELSPILNKTNYLLKGLMQEENNMRILRDETQDCFSDQEAGKALIAELMQTINELQGAYCELEQLKGEIAEYIHILTA